MCLGLPQKIFGGPVRAPLPMAETPPSAAREPTPAENEAALAARNAQLARERAIAENQADGRQLTDNGGVYVDLDGGGAAGKDKKPIEAFAESNNPATAFRDAIGQALNPPTTTFTKRPTQKGVAAQRPGGGVKDAGVAGGTGRVIG